MRLAFARYDPEYARAYREKQRAKRDAARAQGAVVAPLKPTSPPPPPVPIATAPRPVAQAVQLLERDESTPCACARPGSTINDEQVAALLPKRSGWTTSSRPQTVAVLKKTPEGRQLLKTIDSFQSGASVAIPRLRTDIEKHLNGQALEPGRESAVRNVLDAIAKVSTDRVLYRGMVAPMHVDDVLRRYKPGDDMPISLASFTTDRKLGLEFGEQGAGQKVRSSIRTPVLIEWVEGTTKHALPIENLGKSRIFGNEKEWVGAGQYRILSVEQKKRTYRDGRPPADSVIIRVEQVKTW